MSAEIGQIGRALVVIGASIMMIGGLMMLGAKTEFALPGDILIRRPGFTFSFPVMTSIVLSVVLTLLFWIIGRFMK